MIATIAIIDDDDAVRDSTRLFLECNDYSVREYPSAEDFLNQQRNDVDCVLVDYHMPGMKGLDLLERLHAEGECIPALVLTGRVEPSMEPRAARVGVKVLQKPVPGDHLVTLIEEARKTRANRAR